MQFRRNGVDVPNLIQNLSEIILFFAEFVVFPHLRAIFRAFECCEGSNNAVDANNKDKTMNKSNGKRIFAV